MARIFVVENDPEFVSILRRILEADGFDVSWADNISNAISRLHEVDPEVAIVDIPDDGSDNIESISSFLKQSQNIPILVTTSYTSPDIACKAIGAGAADFLLKPFGTNEILERIHSLTGSGIDDYPGSDEENSADILARSVKFISSLDDWP